MLETTPPPPNVHDITHDVPDFINEAYQITYHMPSWHTSSVSPRLNCLTPGHGKKKKTTRRTFD